MTYHHRKVRSQLCLWLWKSVTDHRLWELVIPRSAQCQDAQAAGRRYVLSRFGTELMLNRPVVADDNLRQ